MSALLLMVWAAAAEAAIVFLKDGGRLQGTVVGATAREVELYTPDGTLRISADRIVSIDYQGLVPPASKPPPPEPSRQRQQEFAIDFGVTGPLSDVDFKPIGGGSAGNGDAGSVLGVQYLYYASRRLALGGGLQWLRRAATDSFGLLANTDANVFGDSLVFLGLMKYELLDWGAARPFMMWGAGAHRTSTLIDDTPNPGFAWSDTNTDETRRLIDDRVWGFAAQARLGVDFHAFDPGVFSFDVGWTTLAGSAYRATAAGRALGLDGVSGPIQILTVAGRWAWRF